MRLVPVINDMAAGKDNHTSIRPARRGVAQGHEIALVPLAGIDHEADGTEMA